MKYINKYLLDEQLEDWCKKNRVKINRATVKRE